jgi:hypothetical protein
MRGSSPCVLDRTEARWELGSILQGFELRLGWILIRDVRRAVSFGDVHIDERLYLPIRSRSVIVKLEVY